MDPSRLETDRAERRREDSVCEMDCWADGKCSASRVGKEPDSMLYPVANFSLGIALGCGRTLG